MGFASPSASFGYYRGSPLAGGQGSGQGHNPMGSNTFAAGQGPGTSSGTGWHPTVLYMLVLIIAEMFVFAFISRHL